MLPVLLFIARKAVCEFTSPSLRWLFLSMEISKGGESMAKTSSSIRGVQHKKIVPVHGYTKSDGTRVSGHRRSTPK